MRAIGRPDFPQDRAALRHDFRNAKAIPDFDQFAARNQHFAVFRQRRQDQQHRGGAIVHHDGCLRSGQPFQQVRGVHIAFAAFASFQIVFKIVVLRGRPAKFFHHGSGQRCPP